MTGEASPRSILVRAPNWLGDCVMAEPALRALARAHPNAHIAVEARPGTAGIFRWMEAVDEVVPCPDGGGWRNHAEKAGHARALRARNFAWGILLTHSFSTALWMWRSGLERRFGTATPGRGLFLTDPGPLTPELRQAHQVDQYLAIAASAGADPSHEDPKLRLPGSRPGAGDLPETPPTPYAVLGPGSAYGPAKDWLPERYAELAKRLAEEGGLDVVLTGTQNDRPLAERIARESGGERIHNRAGETSLDGFLRLLAGAACFVGNDSGAAHCAGALGIPAAVLFGSTRPERTRPAGPKVACIVGSAPCAPCLRRRCAHAEAPMACMRSIPAGRVWESLAEFGVFSGPEGTDAP